MAVSDAGSLGRQSEDLALDHLRRAGLRLLERNFHSRFGEIDLIMRDRDCLVFVEVRYRQANRIASALESVGPHKQAKLTRAASFYVSRHPRCAEQPMRFDVVAIDTGADGDELVWVRDAFRPGWS